MLMSEGVWTVSEMCAALKVARWGYYACLSRGPSARTSWDAATSARSRGSALMDWQPLYGYLRQRLSPASLNSTGLMYPSFECSLKLLYQWT